MPLWSTISKGEKRSFCCANKCFELSILEVDGLACKRCGCFGQCHCRCKKYGGTQKYDGKSLEDASIDREDEFSVKDSTRYCCKKMCTKLYGDVVDGLACKKCYSFNQCLCPCETWMKKYMMKCKQFYDDLHDDSQFWPDKLIENGVSYCCSQKCIRLIKN